MEARKKTRRERREAENVKQIRDTERMTVGETTLMRDREARE